MSYARGGAQKAEKYNGWTNYETWAVNLWLTNEPYTDTELRNVVQPCVGDDATKADYECAENLKDWVTSIMPDLGASLASDLLSAALSEVDWLEIIENHKGD